jgi:hypothetical protein
VTELCGLTVKLQRKLEKYTVKEYQSKQWNNSQGRIDALAGGGKVNGNVRPEQAQLNA